MGRKRTSSTFEPLESRLLFARALGIDVSGNQPNINWTSVKNSGRTFAWTKATEGKTFDDTSYSSHVSGADAAGVLIGGYHYARPDNNSAADEVAHFLAVAGNQVKAGYLRPMLDFENPVQAGDAVDTPAELSQWVNDWCNGIYNATGVIPVVYTYQSYASTYLTNAVTQWPLWMAQYPGSPNPQTGAPAGTTPWPLSAWKIWQYSSTTAVPGISGNCDADVFNGDQAAFDAAMVIQVPEVTVTQAGGNITDGQAGAVSFGSVNVGAAAPVLTFTVKNDGNALLTLSGLTLPAGYSISGGDGLVSSLSEGESDTFKVQLDTSVAGTKTGNISFTTNDSNENPFNFPVTGTVVTPAPNPPSGLAVTTYTSSSVSLSWTDNSSNETGFVIERCTGPGGNFSQVGTAGANISVFVDPTAAANTNYYYHVRSANGANTSSASNDVIVTTLAAIPTALAASDGIFNDHVSLTWAAAAGATKYQLYRNTVNDASTAALLAQSLGTSFDDFPPASTTYYYWVASFNTANVLSPKSDGDSGFKDGIAPAINSSNFQSLASPIFLSFTFSEPVGASLGLGNISITNVDSPGGATPAVQSYSYLPASNTAQFFLDSSLPDGNFRASLSGVTDAAGNALAGDTTQSFHFLRGDASGDRAVNALDFGALASHYGAIGAGFSGGDFNFDGTVDSLDFAALATHFNTTLPAPLPTPPSAANLFADAPVQKTDLLDSPPSLDLPV